MLKKNFKESLVQFEIPIAIFSSNEKIFKFQIDAPDESCFYNIKIDH